MRTLLVLLLGASVAAAALSQVADATPGQPRQPVSVNSFGRWSLAELGYGRLKLASAEPQKTIRYRLPEGASQGPEKWYILHIHFRVSVQSNRQGVLYLFATTSGRGAAQLRFMIGHDQTGAPRLSESALGIINGETTKSTRGRRHEGWFANYLQYRGVRPGLNELVFTLSELRGNPDVAIEILPDTALEYSKRRPPELRLDADVHESTIRRGERFRVFYEIKNVGGYDARDFRVVTTSGPGIKSLGRPNEHEVVGSGKAVRGQASFVASQEGLTFVTLAVDGYTSEPLVRIELAIGTQGLRFGWYSVALMAAATALITLALLFFWRRKLGS